MTRSEPYGGESSEIPKPALFPGGLAADRHQDSIANYLYADGGVRAIAAQQIATWCNPGMSFVIPPQ
ncbi:MAG: hypothetical protein AAGJ46_02350 [Planctomycetota bacterium]